MLTPFDKLGVFVALRQVALDRKQIVGEKGDYYVTLQQVEEVLKDLQITVHK
jgi:hypothetical protein